MRLFNTVKLQKVSTLKKISPAAQNVLQQFILMAGDARPTLILTDDEVFPNLRITQMQWKFSIKLIWQQGAQLDEITYLSTLKAYASSSALKWGKEVHARISHDGLESDYGIEPDVLHCTLTPAIQMHLLPLTSALRYCKIQKI